MSSRTAAANLTTIGRVLDNDIYRSVCDFINDYPGLPIDCEIELLEHFPQIHRLTLKAILDMQHINRMRSVHWQYETNVKKYLAIYKECSKKNPHDTILLNIARDERIGPVMMCRTMLKYQYKLTKTQLAKLIRYPQLIEDALLAANVEQCLKSDSQDGPLIDMRRRLLGEEYEVKLKQKADEAGMHFYDEKDLRRLGYDKTPDIKMILPFMYKGEIINWIESKANFGDIKTHKWNIKQQLHSYCNRFGAGIVIYWFGYHQMTPTLSDNAVGITVLHDFPSQNEIELLDLSEKTIVMETTDNKET